MTNKPLLLVLLPTQEAHRRQLQCICEDTLDYVITTRQSPEYPALLEKTQMIFGEPAPDELLRAKELRWLQTSWAGVNHFLPALCAMPSLALTNASGAFGVTIAEHAIALLLSIARNLNAYGLQQSHEIWHDVGSEWTLEGKRALILGTGDLGSNIASRLKAFGMTTVGFCRRPEIQIGSFDRLITAASLDEELTKADAIFGCLPGTPQTAQLLTADRLCAVKHEAILINVGRGSLFRTEDLLAALSAGKFFGVGLDVVEEEPLPPQHPLWHHPKVVLTPHVAGIGQGHLPQTENRIWAIFLENLRRYLKGEPLNNLVDPAQGY